jgi:hypothetical protein
VKNKKRYHTVETIAKSKKSKGFQRGNTDTNKTQIHNLPLFWFGTGTLIRSGWVKLAQTDITVCSRVVNIARTCYSDWVFPVSPL